MFYFFYILALISSINFVKYAPPEHYITFTHYFYSDNEGHIFSKITNDSNENKTLTIPADTGFMQGIFVEYGITVDDDATEIRNGGFGRVLFSLESFVIFEKMWPSLSE